MVVIAEWLNSRQSTQMQDRLSTRSRAERGICNNVTGRLLCPIEFDWDNPEYIPYPLVYLYYHGLIVLFSVRANLRNAAPGYNCCEQYL